MAIRFSIFRSTLIAITLFSVFFITDVDATTRRFRVVLVTPVKPQYSQEDMLQSALASRISVDIARITWSERTEDSADLIKRVRALNPDLIYTWGTVTTKAIAGTYDSVDPVTNIVDVPIVFFTVAWPDQTKIVHSFERPGRNVTGITHVAPIQEQMNTLLRWGKLKHSAIGTVYSALEPNSLVTVRDLQKWCDERKIKFYAEPVTPVWNEETDKGNIRDAVARLAKKNVDWLYIGPDKMMGLAYAGVVTDAALEYRVPTFSAVEAPVRRASALWGMYTPIEHAAIKAADIIVAILNGSAVPADIPVATMRQNIVINQNTMTALGFYPPTVLRRIANIVRGP